VVFAEGGPHGVLARDLTRDLIHIMESLQLFAALTVFTLMLSIGMKQSLSNLAVAWKNPGDFLRALLSSLILFPALAFIL